MSNKQLLLRYAELKIQEKQIAEEIELIKKDVQAEVEALIGDADAPLKLKELPDHSFSLAKARPKWEYSTGVQAAIKNVEELKKDEEATGKATNLNDGKKELKFNSPKKHD